MIGVIILAAGQGSRMKTDEPKILIPIGGKPILQFVVEAAESLSPHQILIVGNPSLKEAHFPWLKNHSVVIQESPIGTGDAVKVALQSLHPSITRVLILCGDVPLIQPQTLAPLIRHENDGVVLSTYLPNTHHHLPYGRLDVEGNCVKRIIEWKEASPSERLIPLINSGVMAIQRQALESAIHNLKPSPHTHEYYLTDIIEMLTQSGRVIHHHMGDWGELQGMNTLKELAQVEAIFYHRWRSKLMDNGVRVLAPDTLFLNADTTVAPGTIIHPYVTLGKGVTISENCTIFSFSHLEDCILHSYVQVGPFAHIRGHTTLDSHVQIGNFVEVKKSHFHTHSKAKHLSYVGDTKVGEKTNIGAGAITCNYDGISKYKTTIGQNCFVGSNVTLIAPIDIGEGSFLAAGSVITENVDPNMRAFGRSRQTIKPKKPIHE